ncbi:efflux RND transporter periplasmic adaptor subunit [Stieleria sp.]|uniref:efflux RND transporter periplasmic adaptor subunit n=1 Tax=Stieleria sp. TaxID=2795976 RepID=UPI003561B871
MRKRLRRFLLPLIVLTVGIAVAAVLIATRPESTANPEQVRPRLVRTFRATPTRHRPAVHAYGTAQADQQWNAIAEVTGRINVLADTFDDGEVLQEGTLIAQIDPRDYQSALDAAKADLQSQREQLEEIRRSMSNVADLIALREEQVAIAKSELDRLRELSDRNAGSRSELERAASSHLESKTALQNLQNELRLLPIRERMTESSIKSAELRVEQAERDLQRCTIVMPFTGLCINRSVEPHEHVAIGQPLGQFISVDRAQVVAMVEARRMLNLLPKLSDAIGTIDLRNQSTSLVAELRKRIGSMGVPVDLTWRAGEGESSWRGSLARVSATVDQTTRAIPLIIEVEDAFSAIKLGKKPALVPGLFLEVVLYGDPLDGVFVVPSDTIRDGTMYVVREGRLEIVAVDVRNVERNRSVVDAGLRDGDQVVMTDLFPAATGMPLRVEEVDNPVRPRLGLPEVPQP